MRYTIPDGEKDEPNTEETPTEPLIATPEQSLDGTVNDQVTARVYVAQGLVLLYTNNY